MSAEYRFNVIGSDPGHRLIHVHRASLAFTPASRHADDAAPACRESDAGQCRIVVNALRREIDRLARGFGPVPLNACWSKDSRDNCPIDELASPPDRTKHERPIIDRTTTIVRPAAPPPPPLIVLPLLTTNTGGLIDLLA